MVETNTDTSASILSWSLWIAQVIDYVETTLQVRYLV